MKAAVCDDNKSMLEFISAQIAECAEAHGINCEISSFLSGINFIAEQQKNAFDIVFLDIKMPDSDGFEVAKRIRSSTTDNMQIIFITTEDSLDQQMCHNKRKPTYLYVYINKQHICGGNIKMY